MYQCSEGATSIDPDEAFELLPKHIQSKDELNEWEQNNILQAEQWAFARKRKNLLSYEFIKKLHYQMFNKTWQWAGDFRKSNKNIGIDWHLIHAELGMMLKETEYQLLHKTYEIKEIAARFHHKLVFIHCFVNGNGRHARLATDILLSSLGYGRFSWGER